MPDHAGDQLSQSGTTYGAMGGLGTSCSTANGSVGGPAAAAMNGPGGPT